MTLLTDGLQPRLGSIDAGRMRPNAAGQMVLATWRELGTRLPSLRLDTVGLMPNHIHGILGHVERDAAARPPLDAVLRRFAALTARRYAEGARLDGWAPLAGELWRPGFLAHTIRNETDLRRIRALIATNPAQWEQDEFHVA